MEALIKEKQNKRVKILTKLVEDCLNKANKAIVLKDFDNTKNSLEASKEIVNIITEHNYLPKEDYVSLENKHDEVVKNAAQVFMYGRMAQNIKDLWGLK